MSVILSVRKFGKVLDQKRMKTNVVRSGNRSDPKLKWSVEKEGSCVAREKEESGH